MRWDLPEIFKLVRGYRKSGEFKEALEQFPPEWETISDLEYRAMLAKERGVCCFYLREYLAAYKYVEMAYDLHQHVTSADDRLEIVNSYAWLLLESGNAKEVGGVLAPVRDEYESDEQKRNTTLKGSIGAYMYWQWGTAECELGHYDVGITLLEHAIGIFQSLNCSESLEQWCVVLPMVETILTRRDRSHDRSDDQVIARGWLDKFGVVLADFSAEGYPRKLASHWHRCNALWHKNAGDLAGAETEVLKAMELAGHGEREMAACAVLAGEIKKLMGTITDEDRKEIRRQCLAAKANGLVIAAMEL